MNDIQMSPQSPTISIAEGESNKNGLTAVTPFTIAAHTTSDDNGCYTKENAVSKI